MASRTNDENPARQFLLEIRALCLVLVLSMPLDVYNGIFRQKRKNQKCDSVLIFVVLPISLRRRRQSLEFNSISSSCNRWIISRLTPNGTHAQQNNLRSDM